MDIQNKAGLNVGTFSDGVYKTYRKKNHYMIKFQGYGVSYDILLKLKSLDCKIVRIVYQGATGVKVLDTPLQKFLDSKKQENYSGRLSKNQNDLQLFVSERDMQLMNAPLTDEDKIPKQDNLFK